MNVMKVVVAAALFALANTSFAQSLSVTNNLALWLRADSITGVSDGGAVSTWPDSSGGGHHATVPNASAAPIFKTSILSGKPVVRFNGTDQALGGATSALPAPFTLFTVVSFAQTSQGSGDYDYVLNIGDDTTSGANASISRHASDGSNDNKYYCWEGTVLATGPVLAAQSFKILSVVHKTSTPHHNLYINGATQTVADYPNALSVNGSYLVGRYVNDSYAHYLNGDVAEILIYSAGLSDSDRQKVERYLGAKYLLPGYTEPGTLIQISQNRRHWWHSLASTGWRNLLAFRSDRSHS